MGVSRNWFEDQVALVTGAGSGIGRAVVARLLAEGCAVVIAVDVDADGLAATLAAQVTPEGTVDTQIVDVSDSRAVDAVFDHAVAQYGRMDVVVHAAGIDHPVAKNLRREAVAKGQPVLVTPSIQDEDYRRIMAVNLDGTFHLLRAAARVMVPQGSGAIVTVGSSSAFDTFAGYGVYAASKAAVHALSQSVAKELAWFGIRVNTVAPGPVDTGMAARTPEVARQAMAASGPRGYASAEELADAIAYLASPSAANTIGAVLLSNGGRFTV